MRPLAIPLRMWGRVSWIGRKSSRTSQVPYVLARQSVWTPSLWMACRVAGKAYWCQLAEIAKQVVSCNQFPDAWKGGIMCGVPRKPGVPLTLEQSRGILVSTPNSTMIGKVLNKRVALAVEKTSKSWQIGCRPGFGTELPSLVSMEFLAMCKQQQRPAAILSCRLERGVLPRDPRTNCWSFPTWTEADLSEHLKRARANPLRAAGLSKAWTALLRQWFTGGWFLVEGDSQPCLHVIGIKPSDTSAAAGFSTCSSSSFKRFCGTA